MNPSFDDLFFLIPGLICYATFCLFTEGLEKKEMGKIFAISFVISVIEYFVFSPLLTNFEMLKTWAQRLIIFSVFFLLPVVLGYCISLLAESKKFRDFFNFPHPCATAWDYVFSSYGEWCYVIVTLTGSPEKKVYGIFDSNSLASGDCDERDLFLARTFNDKWEPPVNSQTGVLIRSDQIRYIEIINTKGEKKKDGKEKQSL